MQTDDTDWVRIEHAKIGKEANPVESSCKSHPQDIPSTDVGVSLERGGRQLRESTGALREYLPQCDRDAHEVLRDVTVKSASRFHACLLPYTEGVIRKARRCCDDFQLLTLSEYRHSEGPDDIKSLREEVGLARSLFQLAMADFREFQKMLRQTAAEDLGMHSPSGAADQCQNGKKGIEKRIKTAAARNWKKVAAFIKTGKMDPGTVGLLAASASATVSTITIPNLATGAAVGLVPHVVTAVAVFGAAFLAAHHVSKEVTEGKECLSNGGKPFEEEGKSSSPEYPKASLLDTAEEFHTAMTKMNLFLGEIQAIVGGSDGTPPGNETDPEIEKRHAKAQDKARAVIQACKYFQECATVASTDLLSLEEFLEAEFDMEAWIEPLKEDIERCGLTGCFPDVPLFTDDVWQKELSFFGGGNQKKNRIECARFKMGECIV